MVAVHGRRTFGARIAMPHHRPRPRPIKLIHGLASKCKFLIISFNLIL